MTHEDARLLHAEHLYRGTPVPKTPEPPLTWLQIARAPFALFALPFVLLWVRLKP